MDVWAGELELAVVVVVVVVAASAVTLLLPVGHVCGPEDQFLCPAVSSAELMTSHGSEEKKVQSFSQINSFPPPSPQWVLLHTP